MSVQQNEHLSGREIGDEMRRKQMRGLLSVEAKKCLGSLSLQAKKNSVFFRRERKNRLRPLLGIFSRNLCFLGSFFPFATF